MFKIYLLPLTIKMYKNNNLKKFVNQSFKDSIANILLKNSNLTTIQFETLIIDFLTVNMIENELTFKDKALLRSKKVSRGSFSRTLSQARKNIISSIYTILLLSYIGIFNSNPFVEYKSLAKKLGEYKELVKDLNISNSKSLIQRLEHELKEGIKSLSLPRSLKTM
jgi:hypothetical protein